MKIGALLRFCSSLLLLMAKPVALCVGCWTGLRAKYFYSYSFLMHVVLIANRQYHLLLSWNSSAGMDYLMFTKTWRAESCLCRFQFPSYCCRWRSLSSPGCSLIRIVSSATLGSVTSAWFYPRLKCSLLVFDTSSKISTTNRNSYPLIEEIRPVNDISGVLYLVDPMSPKQQYSGKWFTFLVALILH